MATRLLRSVLFSPGKKERVMHKALGLSADAFVFDLEVRLAWILAYGNGNAKNAMLLVVLILFAMWGLAGCGAAGGESRSARDCSAILPREPFCGTQQVRGASHQRPSHSCGREGFRSHCTRCFAAQRNRVAES